MARKVYRLVNKDAEINLQTHQKEIIEAVNAVAPGKNPVVFTDRFEVDELTHQESVKLGRELCKIESLRVCGKKTQIYRLFYGKTKE